MDWKNKIAIILMTLSLVALVVPLSGCGSASKAQAQVNQEVTVQRGNLEIDITATGNLAYTDKQDLAFEIGGTVGGTQLTVEEVLVKEGDNVKKGQVLARLDDSAWQDYLETLRNNVTTAQRSQTTRERTLTAKQRLVDTRQSDLEASQRQVATRELALRQAQITLQSAQYTLSQITYVKSAQRSVDVAEARLVMAQAELERAIKSGGQASLVNYPTDSNITSVDIDLLRVGVIEAQKTLAQAKAELQDIITNSGVHFSSDVATDIATKALAVDTAQKGVDDAQVAIDIAKTAVVTARNALDDAGLDVDDAKISVDDAKKSVADAQKTLDEALAKSTQVVAPFDGFITAVNAEGGAEVNKGFVACVIADPNKFESTILVGEMDIAKVKLDGTATVAVDSLSGISFPAKVTSISPTATVSSGVVNFKVKVGLESLAPVQSSQQKTAQTVSVPTAATTTVSQNIQLREGLTVTVNIVVEKKTNVLIVPNKAIATESGKTYVQVVSSSGTIEKRLVQTGIKDYQYTEVTQGLIEGEQVIVSRTATTTTTKTTTTQQQPGGIMIPGVTGGGGPPPGGP